MTPQMDNNSMTNQKRSRAEINAQNSLKSTGPKTDAGKQRSRQNAIRHGLCGAIAMPNEDPLKAYERETEWNSFYKPQTPGAQHLVNECVRATLLSDRLGTYSDATVSGQINKARHALECLREEVVEDARQFFVTDAEKAVRILSESAAGCTFMADRWQMLSDRFIERGHWAYEDRGQAIWLCGVTMTPEFLLGDRRAWQISYFDSICREKDPLYSARFYCENKDNHDGLGHLYRKDNPPSKEFCREWLLNLATEMRDFYRTRAQELREAFDFAEMEAAEACALVITDEKQARLFLRYSSEARNTFHKAYSALLRTLELDKKRAEQELKEGVKVEFRNEANPEDNPIPEKEIGQGTGEQSGAEEGSRGAHIARNGDTGMAQGGGSAPQTGENRVSPSP